MTTLEAFDVPFNQLESSIIEWVREALDLRHGAAGDPKGSIKGAPQEHVDEVLDLLVRVRSRSDRVAELLSKATLARGRARRAKDEAAFEAERVLMTATQQVAARRLEYSSAKERASDAALAAFEERRTAHQADRLVSVTNDAYEVINQVHWQLDAIRKELRAILHAFQFESTLER